MTFDMQSARLQFDPPPVPQAAATSAWGAGPGVAARRSGASAAPVADADNPLAPKPPPLPAKAKRVIYLHMSGAPPQHDLFDYKPKLVEHHLQPCPDELLQGPAVRRSSRGTRSCSARRTSSSSTARAGAWVSELLPHLARDRRRHGDRQVDEHRPVQPRPGRAVPATPARPRAGGASMGSWITYGLGSENQDLPGFVVLISGGTDPTGGKSPVEHRLPAVASTRACSAARSASRSCTSTTPRA